MSKVPFYSTAARLLGAAALLAMAACQPHDAATSRAFWDLDYEHQLHHDKVIPRGERLYFEGAPLDPVLRTNQANPANYLSIFRGTDHVFPPNLAADAQFPPKAEHHGDGHEAKGHGEEHGEKHAEKHEESAGHGETPAAAAPEGEKKFFPESGH